MLKTFGLAVMPKKIENVTKIIAKMALEMGRNRSLMSWCSKEEQQKDTNEIPKPNTMAHGMSEHFMESSLICLINIGIVITKENAKGTMMT